jgi:nucleoside-diphosphate-sugar epimerase
VLKAAGPDSAITHEVRSVDDSEVRCPDIEWRRDLLGCETTVDLREGLTWTRDWFERAD